MHADDKGLAPNLLLGSEDGPKPLWLPLGPQSEMQFVEDTVDSAGHTFGGCGPGHRSEASAVAEWLLQPGERHQDLGEELQGLPPAPLRGRVPREEPPPS